MTDELSCRNDGPADGRFLAQLLGSIARRAEQLEVHLRDLRSQAPAVAANGALELDHERERLGWGLLVAAGLVDADGAPARREVRGAEWLADLVELDDGHRPDSWPLARTGAADWRLAHALVRWAWEGAQVGAGKPHLEGQPDGAWVWKVDSTGIAPTAALLATVTAGNPEFRAVGDEQSWCLHLPGDLFVTAEAPS